MLVYTTFLNHTRMKIKRFFKIGLPTPNPQTCQIQYGRKYWHFGSPSHIFIHCFPFIPFIVQQFHLFYVNQCILKRLDGPCWVDSLWVFPRCYVSYCIHILLCIPFTAFHRIHPNLCTQMLTQIKTKQLVMFHNERNSI